MAINWHDLLLALMYGSVIGMFVEAWLIFFKLKTPLHNCLLFNCIAILVNNVGYVMELQAKSEEAWMTALSFSYAGRVFIALSLFMFTVRLCRRHVYVVPESILFFVHIAFYILIATLEKHRLYYVNWVFREDGLFPTLIHEDGIAHTLFMGLQLILALAAYTLLILELRREKDRIARHRIRIILIAYTVEIFLFVSQITGAFAITQVFDISILGHVILTVFMYIVIFRYNLLDIIDVTREYMIDRLSEGIIAADREDRVQYYNKPANTLFPDLSVDPQRVIERLRSLIAEGDTIEYAGRIYRPEESALVDHGENFGSIFSLVDTTELKQNEYRLKADADILEMAAKSMKERLLAAEELVSRDRAMRHDRRHFEALILSLMEDGKEEEAKKCLRERMEQEPRTAVRYCENATINAAITHYVSVAGREGIDVRVSANIPFDPGVNEMQLAITISNLIENAIHACEKVPEGSRFIEITARYKDQLLLEIANACAEKVPLDEEGHPFTEEAGHGVGTRSVLAFIRETDSEIRYIAEEHVFKVRMMIG